MQEYRRIIKKKRWKVEKFILLYYVAHQVSYLTISNTTFAGWNNATGTSAGAINIEKYV